MYVLSKDYLILAEFFFHDILRNAQNEFSSHEEKNLKNNKSKMLPLAQNCEWPKLALIIVKI